PPRPLARAVRRFLGPRDCGLGRGDPQREHQTVSHVLQQLAERAADTAPSPDDRAAGCAALLDLVTAAAAAPPLPFTPALRETYGDGPCVLWLTGERAAPAAAGFHNALLSARLDLDDGHRLARGHPGAAVIPAVLAEADRRAAAGRADDDAAIL